MNKPKRRRKAVNLTLSDVARTMGDALAESQGMRFAQLVEQLIRRELIRVGRLPPVEPGDLVEELGRAAEKFNAAAAKARQAPRKRAA